MARRKIEAFYATPESSEQAYKEDRCAIVYYDSEWRDNIVEYYSHKQKLVGASSHHYDDREDALNTARSYASGKL
jgi:hypothetical protein